MSSQETDRKSLQLKSPGRDMYAYRRFVTCFEPLEGLHNTNLPGPGNEHTIPWIVEAPLNSVEILEALLKPPQPLQIYTARHVPRSMITTEMNPKIPMLDRRQPAYREFIRTQGRLTEDREISYVCVRENVIRDLRRALCARVTPVQLCYISIPYSWGNGHQELLHPWAFVFNRIPDPMPEDKYSYGNGLKELLVELNLTECDFERSLLKPGMTPLPECLRDWYFGIPGQKAALPYYAVDVGGAVSTEGVPSCIPHKDSEGDLNRATDSDPARDEDAI
ncbi:hypothetical protein F5Y10DRAFT_271870 [Nemania abortiva]|nr:hypothetical protein F5Y10DRAFT_271870 [Nemania abortiva]